MHEKVKGQDKGKNAEKQRGNEIGITYAIEGPRQKQKERRGKNKYISTGMITCAIERERERETERERERERETEKREKTKTTTGHTTAEINTP